MTDEEIKAEIEQDPESLGYNGKSNGEKAAIINRVDRPGRRPPTYAMVRRWATENATLIRAQRHSADPAESDEQLASICISFLHGAPADILDTTDPGIEALVNYAHSVGLFGLADGDTDQVNSDRRDELLTLGGTLISRAEELWGIGVRISHQAIREATQ